VLQSLVPLMCQLPQADHMQLSSVIEWLQSALARSSQEMTAALCNWLDRNATQPGLHSAWARFGSSEAQGLLASALPTNMGGSLPSLEAVCSLQCVRHAADAGTVAQVLSSTFAYADGDLCRYPAAAAGLLLQLPAAVAIPAAELGQVIACVLQEYSIDALTEELLQHLKDIGDLPAPDDLLSLIHTCLLDRSGECAAACM
jgi:hypothetical protein